MRRIPVLFSAVLACMSLVVLALASAASGTLPRPKGATPVRLSIVPAYNQCTAPNRTHGPPLAFPSCNPPAEASSSITVGTPDSNGAPANMEGFLKFDVIVGTPGPPDDSDVLVHANITDVRCLAGTTACTGGALTDYTGGLQTQMTYRRTDHFNAIAAGGGTDPATMVDTPLPFAISCAATADPAEGSTCSANTSFNAAVPGLIKDGKRDLIQMGQWTVTDGGPDGIVGTSPNTLFALQGVFIP